MRPFKKQEERLRKAQQVHSENAAKARAVDANTARLKGMRLAKEALDKDAAKEAKQAPQAKGKTSKAQRPDGGHTERPGPEREPPLIANPDEVKGG